jgi:hypothetical protein
LSRSRIPRLRPESCGPPLWRASAFQGSGSAGLLNSTAESARWSFTMHDGIASGEEPRCGLRRQRRGGYEGPRCFAPVHLWMQLSFLPVAFPEVGLSRSFDGPCAGTSWGFRGHIVGLSWSHRGPRAVVGGYRHSAQKSPATAQTDPSRSRCDQTESTTSSRARTWSTSPMSRKPVTETPIVQIKAAQSGTGQHGKSELYEWMWDHFDQLDGDWRGRPDWVARLTRAAKTVNSRWVPGSRSSTAREGPRRTWRSRSRRGTLVGHPSRSMASEPARSASCRPRRRRPLWGPARRSSCRYQVRRNNRCCKHRHAATGPTCSLAFRERCTSLGK